MRCRDGDRVRELISIRQNDDHLRVVAPPSITNVGVRGELRMRIAAQNASEVVYAVGRDGRLPASLLTAGGARTRAATAPRRRSLLFRRVAATSSRASRRRASPSPRLPPRTSSTRTPSIYIRSGTRTGLRRLNDNDQDGDHACERCGATVEGAGYCCVQGSAFARSAGAARAKRGRSAAPRRRLLHGVLGRDERNKGPERGARRGRPAPLAVGTRALRGERVARPRREIDGRRRARARSHPGLFIRCEAHSTGCGLECDGSAPCANESAARGSGRGAAPWASPEAARRPWRRLLGDRVEGVGLAGSRPPMDTKNGRRVEFHLSAVSARRRRADGTTFRPNK